MLRQLGWDIETAEEAKLTGKIPDYKWVAHARKNHRIAITFDELKGEHGEKVSRELRRYGGQVVRINGARNEYRAIGKLLYHFRDWYLFLQQGDGISVISDVGAHGFNNYTPQAYHQHFHKLNAKLFEEYIERRKNRPYKPRNRRTKSTPNGQEQMII